MGALPLSSPSFQGHAGQLGPHRGDPESHFSNSKHFTNSPILRAFEKADYYRKWKACLKRRQRKLLKIQTVYLFYYQTDASFRSSDLNPRSWGGCMKEDCRRCSLSKTQAWLWVWQSEGKVQAEEKRGVSDLTKTTKSSGNSLVVQCLGFCTSIDRGLGLIPGQGTRIPPAKKKLQSSKAVLKDTSGGHS